MPWNDDVHGKVFKSNELKLYYSGSHTWANKLSQLAKQQGAVRNIREHYEPTIGLKKGG